MIKQIWLRLVGRAFLWNLGQDTAGKARRGSTEAGGIGLLGADGSTFFLTLTNPMMILPFAAIFAGLGVAETGGDYASAAILVTGVFTGSALWWLLLSGGVSLFRVKFTPQALVWVNRISGIVVTGFGAFALWGAVASQLQ